MLCREHRLPVKAALVPGNNTLQIVIKSGLTESFRQQAAYPYPVPALQVVTPELIQFMGLELTSL